MTKTIPIELLHSPTRIYRMGGDFGPFGAFAEVQDVRFDGNSYVIVARLVEDNGHTDWVGETEIQFTVDPGDSIDFGGRGEPKLRAETDVSLDEWQAKSDAIDADCLVLQGMVNDLLGYVARPIDERLLEAAVAEAIGVFTEPNTQNEAA